MLNVPRVNPVPGLSVALLRMLTVPLPPATVITPLPLSTALLVRTRLFWKKFVPSPVNCSVAALLPLPTTKSTPLLITDRPMPSVPPFKSTWAPPLVAMRLLTQSAPPLITSQLVLRVAVPTPTASVPTLVTKPPFRVNTLPVAAPVPIVILALNKFQVVPALTVTELLEEPAPRLRPPVQTVALVTLIRLLAPPLPPMVTSPALETTLPTEPPSIL